MRKTKSKMSVFLLCKLSTTFIAVRGNMNYQNSCKLLCSLLFHRLNYGGDG